MIKNAPAAYEPPPLLLDVVFFDEAVVQRLVSEVRPDLAADEAIITTACERLNKAAIWLKVEQGLHEAPTEKVSLATIERLRQRAAALRVELPVTDDEGLEGAGENPRVTDGVTRLLTGTMTRLMRERVASKADGPGNGPTSAEIFGADNAADAFLVLTELLDLLVAASDSELARRAGLSSVKTASPLKGFVRMAGQVYLQLTGAPRLPISRHSDSGKLQGPLIPFLEGCCLHIGEKVKRETLAGWVREIRAEAEKSAPPV